MALMLDGKTCLVTGAGGGVGRELALALARAGASVLVNDVGTSLAGEGATDAPAQSVAEEIRANGGIALHNSGSVAEWESAQQMVALAQDAFGRLDIVVNNAGIVRDKMFFNLGADAWKSVIDVHLTGSFNVARAASAAFRSQKSGSYIHMTSTAGLIGSIGQANYAAAKLGIVGLSRSIAIDMAAYGVRSNCIAPFAWSRMTDSIPAVTQNDKERIERLKVLDAAKIAPLVVYLGSDAAADISGQIFAVRGNEIFLMSQSRPLRGMLNLDGWTPETVESHVIPAMRADFLGLDRSADVFSWDPL